MNEKTGFQIHEHVRQGNKRYRWYLYAVDEKLVAQSPTSYASYTDCYRSWEEAKNVFERVVHVVPWWKRFW